MIETDAGTKPAAAATGACHPHLSRPPPAAVAWPPSMHTIHTLPGFPASVPDIACGWPPGAGAPGELALDVRVAYPWGPPLVFHPKFCVRGNDPIDHGQSERQHRGWRRCVGVRNRVGKSPAGLVWTETRFAGSLAGGRDPDRFTDTGLGGCCRPAADGSGRVAGRFRGFSAMCWSVLSNHPWHTQFLLDCLNCRLRYP